MNRISGRIACGGKIDRIEDLKVLYGKTVKGLAHITLAKTSVTTYPASRRRSRHLVKKFTRHK